MAKHRRVSLSIGKVAQKASIRPFDRARVLGDQDEDMPAQKPNPGTKSRLEAIGEFINENLATTSLDDLQSKEYRNILDIVDHLRTCGLGSILPLPQLVVCGNQSSGKSSVLEAITEVPFPRKENLCTRFATEIILRRDPTESLRTRIIPDKSRSGSEKAKLQAFNETITDFSGLPRLIERATEVMGLNAPETGQRTQNRAFTRDVLSVEIAGPSRPQLTLVDLPGLIQSANKMQTDADIKPIHSLVNDYISEKRTIMLAVISAKDDYANQGILTKCKEVDKDGHRTLGIVTKPDYLRSGSANEKQWINLALNKDVYFERGWHILKNRLSLNISEDEADQSFAARNAAEAAFFQAGQYRDIPDDDKGIATLGTKLSKLLFQHLKQELPNLQAELNTKFQDTINELRILGTKRSSHAEQQRFLMDIAESYRAIVISAVDGHYEHAFFGRVDADDGFANLNNVRRLRAAIQYLNIQFATQMRQHGHKYRFPATADGSGTTADDSLPEQILDEEYQVAMDVQTEISRTKAVEWVKSILIQTRGRELPGNFNPLLISQLFWEQSENWESLAETHINRIAATCTAFIQTAIRYVCKPVLVDVAQKLLDIKLNEVLAHRHANALRELRSIIIDNGNHPITYDPQYVKEVQESRSRKTTAKLQELIKQSCIEVETEHEGKRPLLNPEVLMNNFKEVLQPDMDKTSAEDALDCQLAYYKEKVKYFIATVTEQVIERHMLRNLAEDTLSPLIINDMTAQEIEYIAVEAEGVTRKRGFLEARKAILESGQDAFRNAIGSYK